ncbi:hypothetical protein [Nocardia flavorosea]|uniref:Uncharacterized protein n=1 Tax=Nocardia flavorosea TaxID=53429 RepID=A0A846Y945_9NOCA|nr:hypothetical protein [Nocardia flavorosea]NKY54985.1 hypothetical protein [Nocardia flavorosea]
MVGGGRMKWNINGADQPAPIEELGSVRSFRHECPTVAQENIGEGDHRALGECGSGEQQDGTAIVSKAAISG